MQRLGFCKAVLAFSSLARTTGQMAEVLRMHLEERKFLIPYDAILATWLKDIDKASQSNSEISISLQKFYIYDHPSQTGWLSRLGFKEYTEYLPHGLGLVSGPFEPTGMGLVLTQGLTSAEQIEAYNHPSAINPFVLGCEEQIFFLYNLLAIDGDFMLPFCDALLNRFGNGSFDYLDAGSLVPDTMGDMLDKFSMASYTRSDREQLKRLEDARQKILENIENKDEDKGSGSRREQTTIPRLEWLVDIGAMERIASRTWRFTEVGLKLTELAQVYKAEMKKRYPENVISAILDSCFFKYVSRAYGHIPSRSVSSEQFLPFIWPSYSQLVGVGGYLLFRPLLLYANIINLANQPGLFLEYDESIKLLEAIYQSDPTTLHYTIDRSNTDYQIRIDKYQGKDG